MNFTPEQMNKARSAKSAEELLAMAKESGIEMTEAQAAKYFAELHKQGELNDDELTSVAGGSKGEDPHVLWSGCTGPVTDNNCPVCGAEMRFVGSTTMSGTKHDIYTCDIGGVSFIKSISQANILGLCTVWMWDKY